MNSFSTWDHAYNENCFVNGYFTDSSCSVGTKFNNILLEEKLIWLLFSKPWAWDLLGKIQESRS